jgi:hypothetical protein
MMTVRTAMVSLLPTAIFAQRPGDAIHGCIATLLQQARPATWPEFGNESFQSMQPMRFGGRANFRSVGKFRLGTLPSAKEKEKSDREEGRQGEQYDHQQKGHSHYVTTFDLALLPHRPRIALGPRSV